MKYKYMIFIKDILICTALQKQQKTDIYYLDAIDLFLLKFRSFEANDNYILKTLKKLHIGSSKTDNLSEQSR
jgi:hypothetical protein